MTDLPDTLNHFLEAHVAWELDQFKDHQYRQTIEEEVSAVFAWTQKIKLKDVITASQIIGLIKRNVVELPIAGGVTELAGEMSQKVLASRHNRKTRLQDIFPRKQYDEIIDKVVSLESARNRLIHRCVTSSAYSRQVSELLFNGIKEYVLEENIIAKKVPGVSALIRAGKFAVNNTMLSSLENIIEEKVKRYIESNLERTLRRSETSLVRYFNEDRIVDAGEQVWDLVSKNHLNEYFSTINADDMEDFILIGYEFWLHFRKTKYFEGIYTELVKYFFKKYGNKELYVILEDVGVTKEMVVNELCEIVAPGMETALSTGYLEERIRARLSQFYNSRQAAEALSPSPKKGTRKKNAPKKSTAK